MSHFVNAQLPNLFLEKDTLLQALIAYGFTNVQAEGELKAKNYYGQIIDQEVSILIPGQENKLSSDAFFYYDLTSKSYKLQCDSMDLPRRINPEGIFENYQKVLIENKVKEMEKTAGKAITEWRTLEDGSKQLCVQFTNHVRDYAQAQTFGGI